MTIFARGWRYRYGGDVTSNRDSSLTTQRSVHSGELSASGVMWIRRSLLPITVTLLQTNRGTTIQSRGATAPARRRAGFFTAKFVGVNSILPLGRKDNDCGTNEAICTWASSLARKNGEESVMCKIMADVRGGPVHGHGVRAASGAGYHDCCTSRPLQSRSSSKPHTRRGVCLSWLVLATMLVGWTSSPRGGRSSGPGSGRASLPAWVSSWSSRARMNPTDEGAGPAFIVSACRTPYLTWRRLLHFRPRTAMGNQGFARNALVRYAADVCRPQFPGPGPAKPPSWRSVAARATRALYPQHIYAACGKGIGCYLLPDRDPPR